jgi:hypothetical protein
VKAQQLQDALDQAFEEAEVPATDRPKAKEAFDKASTLKLGDEESLNRAFRTLGTPKEKAEAGKKRFAELKRLYEKNERPGVKPGCLRGIAIAAVVVLLLVVFFVFTNIGGPDDPASAPTPTLAPTVHAVIDRPLDANGTPAAP